MSGPKVMMTLLGGLALASILNTFEFAAPVTRALAAAPCEPVVTQRPSAPRNLRIIGVGSDVFDSPLGFEPSGPYGGSESFAVADVDPHAYFNELTLRADCMVAYSLRSMDQLLAYMDSLTKPRDITYDPVNDPDPRRQDAAKVLIPANTVSLPNNVRLPIPNVGNESLLVTWDSWLGREYAYPVTGIGNWKHFQFASGGRIWTEVKADFDNPITPSPALGMVAVRYYGQEVDGLVGPNVTNRHPLSPMNAQFALMPETWTRYWAYFNKVGDWYEFSLWLSDTNRDPVLINDRLQIKPNYPAGATGWEKFWLEFNTSSHLPEGGIGPRVAYVRNVVMLRGVSGVGSLLQRPIN